VLKSRSTVCSPWRAASTFFFFLMAHTHFQHSYTLVHSHTHTRPIEGPSAGFDDGHQIASSRRKRAAPWKSQPCRAELSCKSLVWRSLAQIFRLFQRLAVHGKKIGNQWILLIDVLKVWKSLGRHPIVFTECKTFIIETNIIRNRILKTFNILRIFIKGNIIIIQKSIDVTN